MPSSASSTAMEAVIHYKKKLMRHVSDQESDVLSHCLMKLDRVPMTIDILQETGIGRVVNSLKKNLDPDSEVAQLARNIVAKWKDIVANHEQEQNIEDEDGCDYEEPEDPEPAEDLGPPDLKPEVEEKPSRSRSDGKRSGSSHKHKRHHKDKESELKSHSSSSKKKKKDKSKSKDRDKDRERSSSRKHKSDSKSSSKSKKREEESTFGSAMASMESKPSSSKTNGTSSSTKSLVDSFDINPNYKPSSHYTPPPSHNNSDSITGNRVSTIKRSTDEELSALMSKKGTKRALYSGVKRSAFKEVPSLKEICIYVLQENVDNIEQCGGLPFDVLEPVLKRASAQTLMQIEEYNPYLMEETGQLWEKHCQKDFPKKQREEFESFREMYERCTTERAAKLEVLTARMGASYKNATENVRRTKLAYVNSAAKPPRSVKRAQERNGTALSQPLPVKRGRPPLGTGSGSSSAPKKPKIAPMMAKTLKLARGLKGGFRR